MGHTTPTFKELGLSDDLVRALAKQGIQRPTPIQAQAIPRLAAGEDAYLCAPTGTGKTLAYVLPIAQRLDPDLRQTQALILAPTHELAIQVRHVVRDLAAHTRTDVRAEALIGGASIKRQVQALRKKPQIVVGSPGRIRDLIGMRKLRVHDVKTLVVDEADRLLFGDALETTQHVISSTLRDRQLIFASATEQPESLRDAQRLAPDMARIGVSPNRTNANIRHGYLLCEERRKVPTLRGVLHALDARRTIVFVHRNTGSEDVAARLVHHGVAAAAIHGHGSGGERKRALQAFRNGKVRVLVASDIAARGLDIEAVDLIVNLDTPTRSKAYLHRVGRTARAGAQGTAVSLVTPNDQWLVERYEKDLDISVDKLRLKGGNLERA